MKLLYIIILHKTTIFAKYNKYVVIVKLLLTKK